MVRFLINKIINILYNIQKISLDNAIIKEIHRGFEINKYQFPEKITLPDNYGKGLPERVVEILFAKLSYKPGLNILDVGNANAMPCHLNMLQSLPPSKNITGIDITVPKYKINPYYNQFIVEDISKCSLSPNSFDLIWCISTLEHIGMDNSPYVDSFAVEERADLKAVSKMISLLKNGGRLLITVPYGKYENHGWFKNYDQAHLKEIIDSIKDITKVRCWYFRHTYGAGWQMVSPEELQYVGYYDQANSGAGGLAVLYITKIGNLAEIKSSD